MNEAKQQQQIENEMRLEEGFTVQELERRTEMFYCCQGSGGGASCGSGDPPA